MTAYTFNFGIPASGNNPSNDQPLMLSNNVSSNSILAVDHVGYNSVGSGGPGSSGGQHLQVTYNNTFPPASLPTNPISIGFTANASSPTGVLASLPISSATTNAQNFYCNQNGVFPLSAIRAFGIFTTPVLSPPLSNTFLTFGNAFNVLTTSYIAGNSKSIVINLAVGATNGTNFIPFVDQLSGSSVLSSVTTTANTITLSGNFASPGTVFSFMILQV